MTIPNGIIDNSVYSYEDQIKDMREVLLHIAAGLDEIIKESYYETRHTDSEGCLDHIYEIAKTLRESPLKYEIES